MKKRQDIGVGDAVEIRVIQRKGSPLKGDVQTKEVWLPATVVSLSIMGIGVALANSERIEIPLHKTEDWRVPAVTQLPTKWGTFTLDHIRELNTACQAAKADGKTEFESMGGNWLVSFTDYLIEHARNEGMVL